MQEFEYLADELRALGVRVRAITAQPGDTREMLATQGVFLKYVEVVTDSGFSICNDYKEKGLNLLYAEHLEVDPKAKHPMVEPAWVIEDAKGNWAYTWSWDNINPKFFKNPRIYETNGPAVIIRPTPESLLECVKNGGDFSNMKTANYPTTWPRKNSPFEKLPKPNMPGAGPAKL